MIQIHDENGVIAKLENEESNVIHLAWNASQRQEHVVIVITNGKWEYIQPVRVADVLQEIINA